MPYNIIMKKKYIPIIIIPVIVALLFFACATNPLTGQRHMALVSNAELFPASFAQYNEILEQSKIITGTPEAEMVKRVGLRLTEAAEKWYASIGESNYLADYRWEYNLIEENTVNAWCMPGGKIAFYTGILPYTQNEAGLAVVMGHEICHALLNHGQQRVSADTVQQGGALAATVAMQIFGVPEGIQSMGMLGYQLGSTYLGTMPFGRNHESEADRFGLTLMAIAGYDPDEAPVFWQRMSASGGASIPQWMSTHPSDETRVRQLQGWVPEAKAKAAEFGINF